MVFFLNGRNFAIVQQGPDILIADLISAVCSIDCFNRCDILFQRILSKT